MYVYIICCACSICVSCTHMNAREMPMFTCGLWKMTFAIFFQSLYCCLELKSLIEPEAHHFSYIGQPVSSWDIPVSNSPCWGYNMSNCSWCFICVLEIWTQVFLLIKQALLPKEPSCQPIYYFVHWHSKGSLPEWDKHLWNWTTGVSYLSSFQCCTKTWNLSVVRVAPCTYLFLFPFFLPRNVYCNQNIFWEAEMFSLGPLWQTVNNTMDRTENLSSGCVCWRLVSHFISKLYYSEQSLISATFLGFLYGFGSLRHIRSYFIFWEHA